MVRDELLKQNRDSTHQHSVPGRCHDLPTRAPTLRDQRRQSDGRLPVRTQQPEPGHTGWFIPTPPTHSIIAPHSFIHSYMCVSYSVSRKPFNLYVLNVCYVVCMCACNAVGQPVAVPGAGTRARHVIECQQSGGG